MDTDAATETEKIFVRLQAHRGVLALVASTAEGIPIRTTINPGATQVHCSALKPLVSKSKDVVRSLDPTDDLQFLRLRGKNTEIILAPEGGDFLIAVQEVAEQ
nr:unnamed protein product [Spirometra erinaceieuropaei]